MSMRRILALLACVAAFATACSGFSPSTAEEGTRALDGPSEALAEQIVATLRRMSEFLASRPAIRFEADIRYDSIQTSGQKIEFGSHRRIVLRRPDRARVEVSHWDGERELLTFDGERLQVAIPERRVYASMEYAGNVADAFDHLITEYGVASPLSDLLRPDLPDEIATRALSGRRLGTVEIEGTRCDHLVFRGERVDFQLFVRQGDEPVPIRFVIDYHAEPGSPQFRAQLRDWDLEPMLPDSLFRLVPPVGAQRVAFPELMDLLLGPADPEAGDP